MSTTHRISGVRHDDDAAPIAGELTLVVIAAILLGCASWCTLNAIARGMIAPPVQQAGGEHGRDGVAPQGRAGLGVGGKTR
jgi:hypothetical protein